MSYVVDADIDKVYTDTYKFKLGDEYEDSQGRVYVLCKYNEGDSSQAGTAGLFCVALDSAYSPWEVTAEQDSSTITAILQRPVGQIQATLADAELGWLQKKGTNRQTATTDGSVAQGELLMMHASTAGGLDTHDAAAKAVVGVALEADTGTSLTAGQMFINL